MAKYIGLVILFLVAISSAKPIEEKDTGGSFLSTIWGWITYPFTGWWSWSSSSDDLVPLDFSALESSTTHTEQTASETGEARANVDWTDARRINTTVWCNDQTCTTIKCAAKNLCIKVSCIIYDTNVNGECRFFDLKKSLKPPTTTEKMISFKDHPIVIQDETNEQKDKTAGKVTEDAVKGSDHLMESEDNLTKAQIGDPVTEKQTSNTNSL